MNPPPLDIATILGQALAMHRQGRLAVAQPLYEAILADDPEQFDALHLLGTLHSQRGHLALAIPLLVAACAKNQGYGPAQMNLANALLAQGKLAEALAHFDRAVALQPDDADAYSNRGNALRDGGRFIEALHDLDHALALRPDFAEALNNRGFVLHVLGRDTEAMRDYDHALALRPNFTEALNNRSNVWRKLQRDDRALADLEAAILLRPDYHEALNNRGNALRRMKQLAASLASYDRSLACKPDYVDALINRSNTLRELGRLDEAHANLSHALMLQADSPPALNNQGNVLLDLGQPVAALANYDRAITLLPDYAEAQLNAGMTRLLLGDMPRGWEQFEWRWRAPHLGLHKPAYTAPEWRGEHDIRGATILLHTEQGLGDTLQFCRYIPHVAALGARVLLAAPVSLKPLLAALPGLAQLYTHGEILPVFDWQCPLMSLPLAFRTTLATLPTEMPYLSADAIRTAQWRNQLGEPRRLRVGLVWSGGTLHRNDSHRSLPLAALVPWLELDIDFVSLQKEVRADDTTVMAHYPNLRHFGDALQDFADTAALIETMDLVISVDTSAAHLTGALNRPLWLLLPLNPDWRWLLQRDDSPWYPSARLFRQTAHDDWTPVLAAIGQALVDKVSA